MNEKSREMQKLERVVEYAEKILAETQTTPPELGAVSKLITSARDEAASLYMEFKDHDETHKRQN